MVEQGFAKEPPVVCTGCVYGDKSSALLLATPTGAGRLKHAEVRQLAIRSRVAVKRLRLMKVQGAEDVADVLTMHVSERDMGETTRTNLRVVA